MSDVVCAKEVEYSLTAVVEAILFAAGKPMTPERIVALFVEEKPPALEEIKEILGILQERYVNGGVELKQVAGGYRFQVRQAWAAWVHRLWAEKPVRYTRALLETLALIAYRQPMTRGEIEEVRGVAVSSHTIKTLQEREWIRVVGHRDVPGRPAMYATTRQFLDYFNLKNLQDLPPLGEIKSLGTMNEKWEADLHAEITQDAEHALTFFQNTEKKHPPLTNISLVNNEITNLFKEEKEKTDLEIFTTVDELLANVKTDFTDCASEEVSDVQTKEQDA